MLLLMRTLSSFLDLSQQRTRGPRERTASDLVPYILFYLCSVAKHCSHDVHSITGPGEEDDIARVKIVRDERVLIQHMEVITLELRELKSTDALHVEQKD